VCQNFVLKTKYWGAIPHYLKEVVYLKYKVWDFTLLFKFFLFYKMIWQKYYAYGLSSYYVINNNHFMSSWGQLNFQEGVSVIIELLNYFHDFLIVVLILIITFVTYILVYVTFNPYIDKYTIDSHFLETVWTVIPMFILLIIAFPSLYLLYLIEDISKPSLTIKVVGHQWYWEYQYSNSWFNYTFDSYIVYENSEMPLFYSLDVDNRLVLPTMSRILFLVTSADVIHSWTVPSLGIKVDAIPGRLNYLTSRTLYSGVYYGQCSEICGSNHRFMPIVVEFVPMSSYISYISTL